MGTKNNPGSYDCYAHAEPDEPMFVLRGKDPTAHIVVTFWVKLRQILGGTSDAKLHEARECAAQMLVWAAKKRDATTLMHALDAAKRVLRDPQDMPVSYADNTVSTTPTRAEALALVERLVKSTWVMKDHMGHLVFEALSSEQREEINDAHDKLLAAGGVEGLMRALAETL